VDKKNNGLRYIHYAILFFAMFMLADQVMMYRLTQIGPLTLTAGVFLMPLYYFTGDLIAEVYGFKVAKQAVLAILICCIVFASLVTLLNYLPTPVDWKYKQSYDYVLGHIIRSTILGIGVAVFVGSYINAYIISKLKVIANGRIFILRSIASSAIGELIQMVLGCFLLFTGVFPLNQILHLIISSYMWQVALGAIVSTGGSLLVRLLKHVEGTTYDSVIHFNPFATRALE
jgi:uncharacterized integral membrane protein (TIGR00697 family)